MLLLNASDVAEVFGMAEAFDAVRDAAVAHVRGTTQVPARAALSMAESSAELLVMPGVVDSSVFGLKTWYSFGAKPPTLPQSSAVILLLLPSLGLEVVMDGSVITDLRTGAMTGLAASRLAATGASTVGIIGAGIQARAQAIALIHGCASVSTIRISSRNEQRRIRFTQELQTELAAAYPDRQIDVVSTGTAEAACRDADIIVAATTSATPVIDDAWIGRNALVCGIGSHSPATAELAASTVARARTVVVDTRAGAIDGAGDIAAAIATGQLRREDVIELGTLFLDAGQHPARPDGVAVFKSVGFAAADVMSAELVARRAVLLGLGTTVDVHI